MEMQDQQHCDKRQQIENAIRQAQYEAALARRQYDAVDPDNRLVVGELERRRNDKLVRLMVLGRDLAKAWDSPGVSVETRKKIIRLLMHLRDLESQLGSLATSCAPALPAEDRAVKKNKVGHTRWSVEAAVVDLVRVLARQMPDQTIAAILNRSGKHRGRREVVDADLRDYFASIPHGPLMRCLTRRIADGRLLSIIKSWLTAPVVERSGRRTIRTADARKFKKGTPQGSPLSSLLANIYFRRFLLAWRDHGHQEQLDAYVVNYADDFVICCRPGTPRRR